MLETNLNNAIMLSNCTCLFIKWYLTSNSYGMVCLTLSYLMYTKSTYTYLLITYTSMYNTCTYNYLLTMYTMYATDNHFDMLINQRWKCRNRGTLELNNLYHLVTAMRNPNKQVPYEYIEMAPKKRTIIYLHLHIK